MKKNAVIIFFILLVAQVFAFAQEISIVDVRRNITLADEDIAYKDFYINAGEGAGLKKNLVVNVKRRLSIKDHLAKAVGDFETVVGQVKIIYTNDKISVAREYKLQARDEEPMLEQIGLMAGDRLDLADAFTDTTKPKRKTADANAIASEETKTAALTAPIKAEREPAEQGPPQAAPAAVELAPAPLSPIAPSLDAVPEI